MNRDAGKFPSDGGCDHKGGRD
jgi:hypothetical protein